MGTELFLGSQPHHHDPVGADSTQGMYQSGLTFAALDLAVVDELADRAVKGLVDSAGGAGGLLDAFEEVDHQGRGLGGGDVGGFD